MPQFHPTSVQPTATPGDATHVAMATKLRIAANFQRLVRVVDGHEPRTRTANPGTHSRSFSRASDLPPQIGVLQADTMRHRCSRQVT